MIDDIGMEEVNRWIALAQIDGWGEEHQLLVYLAADALKCKTSDLVPDWLADSQETPETAWKRSQAGLNRLAGF